jgi:hypothetical protein
VAGVAGGRTLLLEKQSPFPGFGAATAVLRRQQARGRVQALSAVSDYKVTPGQGLQSAMPGTTTQLGAVSAVVWAQPLDEMKIRSRGLDDLTTSSWLAQPVGKKWLDVPVGTSWNSYPV